MTSGPFEWQSVAFPTRTGTGRPRRGGRNNVSKSAGDRPLAPLADYKVDGAAPAWDERDSDNLAALAHNREGSMSAFEAERLDVGTGRF